MATVARFVATKGRGPPRKVAALRSADCIPLHRSLTEILIEVFRR